ncbi:unnamed protein product [Amoebophrya sp. A25]|nr:unnamed protein product [Amoebophrya sp. A25]|eukprot:GSA25T00008332001.1
MSWYSTSSDQDNTLSSVLSQIIPPSMALTKQHFAFAGIAAVAVVLLLERLFAQKFLRKDNYPSTTRFIALEVATLRPFRLISFAMHYRNPYQDVDENLMLGASPWLWDVLPGITPGSYSYVQKLIENQNLGAVVNMQAEWSGTTYDEVNRIDMDEDANKTSEDHFKRPLVDHLWLPVLDHHEPTFEQLKEGVLFIAKQVGDGDGDATSSDRDVVTTGDLRQRRSAGASNSSSISNRKSKRVYVHCKAGKGRSGAVVLSYLAYKDRRLLRALLKGDMDQDRQVIPGLKNYKIQTGDPVEKWLLRRNLQLNEKKTVRTKLWAQAGVRRLVEWAIQQD